VRCAVGTPPCTAILRTALARWSGAATAGSPVSRSTGSSNDSAPSGWGFAPQTRTGWAYGPGQDGTIDPRQVVVPSGEEENKGIRAAAVAVTSSPQLTGTTGRCLLHIPFGISAVREGQVQPSIDRSKQAG
jgi:hypothetical protein